MPHDEYPPVLTVLNAEPPGTPIRFTVREYIGTPIFTTGRTYTPDEISGLSPEECRTIIWEAMNKIATESEDMQEGLLILIPGMGDGYHFGLVDRKNGTWGWKSPNGTLVGFLEFDTDDRHCWICSGTANLKSIMALDLYVPEQT